MQRRKADEIHRQKERDTDEQRYKWDQNMFIIYFEQQKSNKERQTGNVSTNY